MIDKTLEEIITFIQREIYQSAGISVQLYTQDLLKQKIEAAFAVLAGDNVNKWKRFRAFEQYTLDGATGRTTIPIRNVFNELGNIDAVYPAGKSRKLTYMSTGKNPYMYIGTTPIHIFGDSADILRVIPVSSTGQIQVVGRALPANSFPNPVTVIPFDYLCLAYFVCWQYAVDDGSNPGMMEKFRQLYTQRYEQLAKAEAFEDIALSNQANVDIPTQWFET